MVVNAAGPIFNVHIFLWGTINSDTVKFTVFSIPFIVVGALVGIWLIKRINDVWYRRFIIIVTVLTALLLIL